MNLLPGFRGRSRRDCEDGTGQGDGVRGASEDHKRKTPYDLPLLYEPCWMAFTH